MLDVTDAAGDNLTIEHSKPPHGGTDRISSFAASIHSHGLILYINGFVIAEHDMLDE